MDTWALQISDLESPARCFAQLPVHHAEDRMRTRGSQSVQRQTATATHPHNDGNFEVTGGNDNTVWQGEIGLRSPEHSIPWVRPSTVSFSWACFAGLAHGGGWFASFRSARRISSLCVEQKKPSHLQTSLVPHASVPTSTTCSVLFPPQLPSRDMGFIRICLATAFFMSVVVQRHRTVVHDQQSRPS